MLNNDADALLQQWMQQFGVQNNASYAADNSVELLQKQMQQWMMQSVPQAANVFAASQHSRSVATTEYPIVCSQGGMRLLDTRHAKRKKESAVIVCIPSLINRYYILDLYPKRSLTHYFNQQDIRSYIIDWQCPAMYEQGFDCADYVAQHLMYAIEAVIDRIDEDIPLYVLGHCMGGILALALSQLEERIDGQILISTPWDFAPQGTLRWPMHAQQRQQVQHYLDSQSTIPGHWVQLLFHMMQPEHLQQKYTKYATMTPKEQQHFMVVENWLNDVVPLSSAVAKECLFDWPEKNLLMQHKWEVEGEVIQPGDNDCPTLLVVPESDSVVPSASSLPLVDALSDVELLKIKKGHISALVGEHAQTTLWEKMVAWMRRG